MNYRKQYLMALLFGLGQIPHPRASIPALENSVRTALLSLGLDTIDPEVPDSYLSLMVPMLLSRGVQFEEIRKVAVATNRLGDPSTGKAGGTLDQTAKTAENEDLFNNIGDVVSGIVELNPGKMVGESVDLVSDFVQSLPFIGQLFGG